MRHAVGRALIIGALGALVFPTVAEAQDWPHWRGPNYDGISSEAGLETAWESGPPKVWEREIGSAFSAISCVDGKVYTCGTRDKQQVLFCLNADTGEVLWQRSIEKEFPETSGGDGTRATPTLDDGRCTSSVRWGDSRALMRRTETRSGAGSSTASRSGVTPPPSSSRATWPLRPPAATAVPSSRWTENR